MEQRSVRFLCAAMFVGILTAAASVPAQLPDDIEVDGSVRAGAQYLDVEGDEAKFNEYRNVDEDLNVVLEEVRVRANREPYYFLFQGWNLDRDDDQRARAEAGRYGRLRLRLGWDETPHRFANDAPFLGTWQGDGYWAVPDIIQQALQPDFPLGVFHGATVAGQTALLGALADAPSLDLDLVRKTGTIDLTYTVLRDFDLRAGYLYRENKGYRPMSAGLYLRDATGANLVGGIGENFTLYGLEFPEPIDYQTDEYTAGLNYRRDNWHLDLAYQFVHFDNEQGTVTWDNPLAFTGTDGVQYGTSLNRLDLFPDFERHLVSLTGAVSDLPFNSRFTGTLSWGRVLQDDDFLPYTVNDVLTVGAGFPAAGQLAAGLALPANDLDGKVDTLLINAVLSSRPSDALSLNFKLNYYDYNDKSKRIAWTNGWARIGETVWSKLSEAGVVNRVPDWRRIKPSIDVSYKVNDMVTLLADYTYIDWERNRDRNADTEENIIGGLIKLTPDPGTLLRLGYSYAERDIDGGYQPQPAAAFFEWDQLRMFDQADRDRNKVYASASLSPSDQLSLGFAFDYKSDRYDKHFYGLQERLGYMTGIDVSYVISDRATLFASYSRDDYRTKTKNRAKSDDAGGGAFTLPENDFKTTVDDTTDTIGGTLSISLIPDKLTFEIGADYSHAKSEFDGSNPNFGTIPPNATTSSATAFDWPDMEINTTQVRAELTYNWTERLTTSLRYLYERVDLHDFATDSVAPYGNAADLQGNTLDYYIFLDANYSDYKAHLFTVMVSYEF